MNEKRLETFIVILEVATSILKGLKKLRGIFKTKKGAKPPSFFYSSGSDLHKKGKKLNIYFTDI